MKIQRYCDSYGDSERNDSGEYILFSDHEAVVKELGVALASFSAWADLMESNHPNLIDLQLLDSLNRDAKLALAKSAQSP